MPSAGDFRKGRNLRIGRYAQHFVDALQMDESPVEYLLNKYPHGEHCWSPPSPTCAQPVQSGRDLGLMLLHTARLAP